jgi:pilus assembly protein CpaB
MSIDLVPAWLQRHGPTLLLPLSLLVLGSIAWWGASRYLALEREALLGQRPATRDVLVAARALVPGDVLDGGSLALRSVPADGLASGTLLEADFSHVQGQRLANPLQAGEPLQRWHLQVVATEGSLASRLAPGRRALTIPVDELNASAGLLRAGDRIDLYASLEREGRRLTAPVLLGLRVLATGRKLEDSSADGEASNFGTITLDVSPEQALRIHTARLSGQLMAMLRPSHDDSNHAAGVRGSLAALLELDDEMPAPRPRVPVLVGGQRVPSTSRLEPESSSEAAALWRIPSTPAASDQPNPEARP